MDNDEKLRLEEERLARAISQKKGSKIGVVGTSSPTTTRNTSSTQQKTASTNVNVTSSPPAGSDSTLSRVSFSAAVENPISKYYQAESLVEHSGDDALKREEDRLTASLQRKSGKTLNFATKNKPTVEQKPAAASTSTNPVSKKGVKVTTEEEKARVKAFEEAEKRREEEARRNQEIERKHAQRRAEEEAARRNQVYNSIMFQEYKPFTLDAPNFGAPPPPPTQEEPKSITSPKSGSLITNSPSIPSYQQYLTYGTAIVNPTQSPQETTEATPPPPTTSLPSPTYTTATSVSSSKSTASTTQYSNDGNQSRNSSIHTNLDDIDMLLRGIQSSVNQSVAEAKTREEKERQQAELRKKREQEEAERRRAEEARERAKLQEEQRKRQEEQRKRIEAERLQREKLEEDRRRQAQMEKERREQYLVELELREQEKQREAESIVSFARAASVSAEEEERKRRVEEEIKRREDEIRRKLEEERRRQEELRRQEEQRRQEEVRRQQEESRRQQEEAKRREEAEERRRQEESRRQQEEAKQREEEVRRRQEEDLKRKQAEERQRLGKGPEKSIIDNLAELQKKEQEAYQRIVDKAINELQQASSIIHQDVTIEEQKATEHLKILPATSAALSQDLVPLLSDNGHEVMMSGTIDWMKIAQRMALVIQSARYACSIAPVSKEQITAFSDDLITQTSLLISAVSNWRASNTEDNQTVAQSTCKAVLSSLLQIIRAINTAVTNTADTPHLAQAPQLQPPQLHPPALDWTDPEDDPLNILSSTELVNNIATIARRLFSLIEEFKRGADITITITAFVDALQAIQANVSETAMIFDIDDGKALVDLTKVLMQSGLEFVREVRVQTSQNIQIDFTHVSINMRANLLAMLKYLSMADRRYRASLESPEQAHLIRELQAAASGLVSALSQQPFNGDFFILEVKSLINVTKNIQSVIASKEHKELITQQAKVLLSQAIQFRNTQSASTKIAIMDALRELVAAGEKAVLA